MKKQKQNWKCVKHRSNDGFWDTDESGKDIWVCWACYYREPYNRPQGKVLQDLEYGDYYIRIVDTGRSHGTYIEGFFEKKKCYNGNMGDLSQSLRVLERIREQLKRGETIGNENMSSHSQPFLRYNSVGTEILREDGAIATPRRHSVVVESQSPVYESIENTTLSNNNPDSVICDRRFHNCRVIGYNIVSCLANRCVFKDCMIGHSEFLNCILVDCVYDSATLESSRELSLMGNCVRDSD